VRAQLVEEGKQLKTQVAAVDAQTETLTDQLHAEGGKIPNDTHREVRELLIDTRRR
jgi:hypothetical protein